MKGGFDFVFLNRGDLDVCIGFGKGAIGGSVIVKATVDILEEAVAIMFKITG